MRPITILTIAITLTTMPHLVLAERSPAQQRTGLELHLSTSDEAYYGREHRLRGTAFEVLGLAELRALPNARIRARCGGAWSEVNAGADGRFELTVQIPENPSFGENDSPHIDLEISHDQDRRELRRDVTLRSPIGLTARNDRVEYEPGETVHTWARVYDVRTRRPLANQLVVFHHAQQGPVEIRTSAAGIAAIEHHLPDEPGTVITQVSVRVGDSPLSASTTIDYRVGNRATTDLFITAAATPETVAPGENVSIAVQVRSPSGFPVRGASVSLTINGTISRATTDFTGEATFETAAPAYSDSANGRVGFGVNVRHPGYGSADAGGSYSIRPPDSYEVEAVYRHGGVVPETDAELILSVFRLSGTAPATDSRVTISGPVVPGGQASATVDRHGFVSLPIRADRSTYARHLGQGDCRGSTATTIDVAIDSDPPQELELCLPVLEDALVATSLRQPAVAPGEPIEVAISRRPAVARRPVVVELFAQIGGHLELVDAVIVPSSADQARFVAPEDRLGLFVIHARPLLDERFDIDRALDEEELTIEGRGVFESLLVRPRTPTFPTLSLDEPLYRVRERAQLTITTPSSAPRSYAAVLVRDLAQHQGERPFREYFLRRSLRRAVLDPSTPEARLLIRAALAARHHLDTDEEQGVARDPIRLAHQLILQDARRWMNSIEELLEDALEHETVDELVVSEGGRRRFRANIIALATEARTEADAPRTLGGGIATADMLRALDGSFTFDNVARRVARKRLVRLLGVLAHYLDPENNSTGRPRGRSSEPPERWLSELVRRGIIAPADLHDPWGGTYVLRRTGRTPRFTVAVEAEGYQLLSPGPDGRIGTADDVADPLARAVPEGSLYARACGEDLLMARFATLSPGSAALTDLLEAYARLNDEALEELTGDALGMVGYGRGGGGSGYGSGYGSLGGRGRGRAPSIRMGAANARGYGLGGIVREDFPATLLFIPEEQLDASGQTNVTIPLADAPTTYIVETIVWRSDGWVWSADERLRVDQELLVDAPLPDSASVGDELQLPLRIANRTSRPRTIRLRLSAEDDLGLEAIDTPAVEVPPRDAVEVPVTLRFRQVAEGAITIRAFENGDRQVDAVRRSIAVRADRRRASESTEGVIDGSGSLTLTVPEGATPVGTNRLTVAVGPEIFIREMSDSWTRWFDALLDRPLNSENRPSPFEHNQLRNGGSTVTLAQLVSANWRSPQISANLLGRAIEILTDSVEAVEVESQRDLYSLAQLLMLLAPAQRQLESRPSLRRDLERLLRALRVKLESGATLFSEAPWLDARVAAALLWSASDTDPNARAIELTERARGGLVTVGDQRWLEGGADDNVDDQLFIASTFLALDELRLGNRDEAFRLIRSLAQLNHASDGMLPEVRGLQHEDRVMAASAVTALSQGRLPRSIEILVDGEQHTIPLDPFRGELQLPALGEAGEHTIEVAQDCGAVLYLRAEAEYTAPWSSPPPLVGPFAISIDGEIGELDRRSNLTLTIRNRVPRLLRSSTVEVSLPAGVEIDEHARRQIRARTSRDIEVSSSSLILRLRPLGPRREVTIPLSWLWTTAGRLNGLGVTAHSLDRPEALSIAPSQVVEVAGREASVNEGGDQ